MIVMRPETKAKRKIEALERKRALIDSLIEFIRTHPNAVDGSDLDRFAKLQYDYAIIRPRWDRTKNCVVLRLEKWIDGEDPYDRYEESDGIFAINRSRIVSEDVTDVPDEKLCEMLDDIHYELIPEDFEQEEEKEESNE